MIYLDHAATTPLHPRVLDAMLPWLREGYGNASSLYDLGRRARKAIEDTRELLADTLGARPGEIVFTSGGSESDTTAILGTAYARAERGSARAERGRTRTAGRHVLTTPIEHHAVLHAFERLGREGFEVEYLPVDGEGRVDPEAVATALRDDTLLVSVMHANNEIGTVQPLREIGAICRERRVPLHSDAVQSFGQVPVDVRALDVSLLAGSAHKIYGPKGVGFLYVRTGVRPQPLILGGSQERGRRAGTENVAGIVGLGAAVQLLRETFDDYVAHCRSLRDALIDAVLAIPGSRLNGPREGRLPNNANFSFEGVNGEGLLILLDNLGIAASSGSACSSGAVDPSHVLLAIGQNRELAFGSLRLTVGRGTSAQDVDTVARALPECVERLRALSPSAG